MGSTFLKLTNKVLVRLNEVEMTASNFASAKNVGAAAKASVIAAVNEINTQEWQWPWNRQSGSGLFTVGTQEVAYGTVAPVDPMVDPEPVNIPTPNDCVPDWASFRVTGVLTETSPGVWEVDASRGTTPLTYMTREQWYTYYRDQDIRSIANGGTSMPAFVFPTSMGGFGVTRMPDANWVVSYEMYVTPAELEMHSDECTIPSVWDYVIVNVALKHYYMYKDNIEATNLWINQGDKSLARMRYAVVNRPDYVYANMVDFGTGSRLGGWDGYINAGSEIV